MGVTESAQNPAWPLHACTHSACSHCHWTHPSHGSTTNPLRCPTGTEFTKPPVVCKSRDHTAIRALKFQPCIWSHASHGISLDFSLAFTCWQPASACKLPEFIDLELHPLWSLWQWGCYSRLHPSIWACTLTMGLQWWTWAPSCTHLQFWLGLDHTLATAAVYARITPVFSLGLSSEVGV